MPIIRETFSWDARAIVALGRESIRNPATAVLELVKNSYDAGADVVRISIEDDEIRISDNGEGMSQTTIIQSWLKIGNSSKRNAPYTAAGRRKIGEKGIGRLSADRLGSHLTLKSQSKKTDSCFLEIDWSKFETAQEVQQVVLEIQTPTVSFDVPQYSSEESPSQFSSVKSSQKITGTELIIKNLREQWDSDDLQELKNQLGTILSPFSSEKFQIQIVASKQATVVSSIFENAGEAHFSCKIPAVPSSRKEATVSFTEWYASTDEKTVEEASLHEIFHGEITLEDIRKVGEVSISLTYIPKSKEVAVSTGFSYADLGRYLKSNAGVRIFRDGIRVYPYGDPSHPDGDWLGLAQRKVASPDAKARRGFKIPPNRILGSVLITRDQNKSLVDVSGREGLQHNLSYKSLCKLVKVCLKRLENTIIRNSTEPETEPERTPREIAKDLSRKLVVLSDEFSKAEKTLRTLPPKKRREVKQLEMKLSSTRTDVEVFGQNVDKLINENTLAHGLATIGIASTTFGHETLGHIQAAHVSAFRARDELEDCGSEDGVDAITRCIAHLDSIEAWGNFALERVRRDKRKYRLVSVSSVANKTAEELRRITDITNVMLEQHIDSNIKIRAFSMDIESIILNLLTNAYYFCRRGNQDRWVIRLGVEASESNGLAGCLIWVADTGPGVPAKERSAIWTPTYTTKPDAEGTGLGLAIISAIVDDYKGHRTVRNDRNLKGARFEIWLPTR